MEIRPDIGRPLEDIVRQALAIAQLFEERVRLNVDGVVVVIKPNNTDKRVFEAALRELKQGLGNKQTESKSLREVRQGEMVGHLKLVCPPYINFRIGEWEKGETWESWVVYFQVAGEPLDGIRVCFKGPEGVPFIGPDVLPLTRENFDKCIYDRCVGKCK